MVKVALVDPSSSTGICLVSALSWVNNYFFLAGAAPLGSGVSKSAGYAAAAVLKASLSTRSASPVSMHGEDTAAPGHLHEVVRWVRRGHELVQRCVAEDGVVGEADGGDVEVDQLRAEVIVGAEGYWESDLSQGAG